jgi:hypothetical protein
MKASRCACNSINVTQYTSAQSFYSYARLKNKKDCADVYSVTLSHDVFATEEPDTNPPHGCVPAKGHNHHECSKVIPNLNKWCN